MKKEFKLYVVLIVSAIFGLVAGLGLIYSIGSIMGLVWPFFAQYFLYGTMLVFCGMMLAGCAAAVSYLKEQIRGVKVQKKLQKDPIFHPSATM